MSLFAAMSLKFLPSRLRTTPSKATEQIQTQKMQLTAQGRGHLFLQLTLGTAGGRGGRPPGVGRTESGQRQGVGEEASELQ